MRYFSLFAGMVLAGAIVAQSPVGTVAPNSSKVLSRMMPTNSPAGVHAPDGKIWILLYEQASSTVNGLVRLRYSEDQGKTWKGDFPVTSAKARTSSIAVVCQGRAHNILHVGYTALTGKAGAGSYWSAWYQAFDTATQKWVGTPTLVADGYGSRNQFYAHSIGVTGTGSVVYCITGNGSGGLGLGSWSCGLWIKKPGGKWPVNGVQVNRSSGTGPNMQIVGERVHLAMRDTQGGYGPIYRSYDVATGKFDQSAVVYVGPNNNTKTGASSIYSFCMDSAGGKYLLWPTGTVVGSGSTVDALRLSYAAPGKGNLNSDWNDPKGITGSHNILFNDKAILGGNTSERWFALVRGYNDNIYVVYSKPGDSFKNLYWELWKGGKRIIPKVFQLTTTTTNRFQWVTGFRRVEHNSSPSFLTWGEYAASSKSGRVDFWRIPASRGYFTTYGSGCLPSAGVTGSLPTTNATNSLTWSGLPKSQAVVVGSSVLAGGPISLGFLGPKCTLDITPLFVSFGAKTDSNGNYTLTARVPNINLDGFGAFIQLVVATSGGGNVSSPAVAFRF